ncbi:sugar ABC transporter substrate-binding protein [Phytoactinopolyspora mesophila]|uniref:Substrate-binding domain-containing protein n=1 Tax=Phytoactinopolyspora mesophila TaxID=2650750 RepID=A0A7K3M0R1_9ACTN|nr:sugar ABC transporter substrate-binding protein [Phytoactinopolyspora mesophila]NDL56840.1 substrate-binding domain-containing protein [Phytoactinopolyspora mesophila]
MRYRRRLGALTAAAALFIVAACGAEIDDDADEVPTAQDGDNEDSDEVDTDLEADGDGPLVTFVSFTQDITEMAGQQLIGLEAAFERAGFTYTLSTAAPAGAEDHEGMDRILEDIATLAPDYAIINPSSYALVDDRIVEIEEAGTVVIVGDIDPSNLEEEPEADPLTWVVTDHYQMGYVGAEHMAHEYCEAGEDITVVPFWGPAASEISQNRVGGALDALDDVLSECGLSYEQIDEVFADFDQELAFNYAESIGTAHPDLDLIIGANSNTALGVMESLITQGRMDDIDIIGNGGQLDELAAICTGGIAAAGFRDSQLMGAEMASAVMAHWEGRSDEIPEITLTDLPVTHDCATVFEHAPIEMLELDGFRSNIPDEMWDEYAG